MGSIGYLHIACLSLLSNHFLYPTLKIQIPQYIAIRHYSSYN